MTPCQFLSSQKNQLSNYMNQRSNVLLNKTNLIENSLNKINIEKNNLIKNYRWAYGDWTKCSAQCLGGFFFLLFFKNN